MKIRFPENNYIVFDFETTGLIPLTDDVIQMSAIKIQDGKKVAAFNKYVNIGKPVPPKITELTGINDETLKKEGVVPEIAWKEFSEFIGPYFALVGHNIIGFDALFLSVNFLKYKIPTPNVHRYIDTAMLYKAMKLQEQQKYFETHYDFASRIKEIRAHGIYFRLSLCCQELGIDVSKFTAHRSDSDIEMTDLVYKQLLKGGEENENKNTN